LIGNILFKLAALGSGLSQALVQLKNTSPAGLAAMPNLQIPVKLFTQTA
jgi:hypothetical protein